MIQNAHNIINDTFYLAQIVFINILHKSDVTSLPSHEKWNEYFIRFLWEFVIFLYIDFFFFPVKF